MKIHLTLFLMLIFLSFNCLSSKPLIIKTNYFREVDIRTKVSSNKEKRTVFFEFDPEDKKTITVIEEGKETVLRVLKYDMNAGDKKKNGVQMVFDCERSITIIYTYGYDTDFHLINIMVGNAPIYLSYSNVELPD